ncbi:MAG: hypothetical protein NVSMB6_19090 [Burkholderiaceae bacterium]
MEQTIGVTLFVRMARGMDLTPAGETLLTFKTHDAPIGSEEYS